MSMATPTQFLLPQLPGYFPPDSPFGDCSTAVFDPVATTAGPRLRRAHIHRRQGDSFANPASTLWPATNGITSTTTYTAQRAVEQTSGSPIGPTQQPVPSPTSTQESSPSAVSSTTVTQPPVAVTPSQASTPGQTSSTKGESSPPPTNEPPSSSLSEQSSLPPVVSPPASVESSTTVISGTTVIIAPLPTGSTQPPVTQGPTSPTSGENVGSSITIPTTGTIGTDGRVTVTETVYYSMISSPGSESLSGSASATSSGPAQQTSGGVAKQGPQWLIVALTIWVTLMVLL